MLGVEFGLMMWLAQKNNAVFLNLGPLASLLVVYSFFMQAEHDQESKVADQ